MPPQRQAPRIALAGLSLCASAGVLACVPAGEGCDRPASLCPSSESTGGESSSTTGATTTSATTTSATTQTTDPVTTNTSATDTADESTTEPLDCNGASLRVVAYNVKSVGFEKSAEWNALGSILARLAPDIVCFGEVGDGETGSLRALTMALGWGEPIQAESSPAIGGELRNACMGPHPMSRVDSYGSEVSGDPSANDVGRDFLAVRLVLDDCPVNVVAVHAKSGQENLDLFRRHVELVRLGQAVGALRVENPGEPIVVMGDFNENTDDPAIGTVFDAVPAGLPQSYELGDDITLPLVYDPFATVAAAGITQLEMTHEDSPRIGTWGVTAEWEGVRIDYIWLDGPQVDGAVVYDACRDDGVDEAPEGQWLPFEGEALPCSATEQASDHLPLVADISLAP